MNNTSLPCQLSDGTPVQGDASTLKFVSAERVSGYEATNSSKLPCICSVSSRFLLRKEQMIYRGPFRPSLQFHNQPRPKSLLEAKNLHQTQTTLLRVIGSMPASLLTHGRNSSAALENSLADLEICVVLCQKWISSRGSFLFRCKEL
ncbi:unnamed protein product [Urochloa humidicola]